MSSAVEILDTDKVVAETKQDSKKVADGSQAFDGNSDVELGNGVRRLFRVCFFFRLLAQNCA